MHLRSNGITLEMQEHGPASGEPLLLIMGLGMQLIAWPDELIDALVRMRFRVIRFDNRDVGLSQHFDHLGVPSLAWAAMRHTLRLSVRSPYGLQDMAADSVGVLDALGIPSAHVCGVSMGGMIAQHMAARHAARTRSLTLVMTTSGRRAVSQPTPAVRRALLRRPPPGDREAAIEQMVHMLMLIGSPGWRPDPQRVRAQVQAAVDRAWHPAGPARQLLAIAADGDRTALLRQIKVPTRIVHGKDDPLVPVAAGHELASRIALSEAEFVAGLGHDLPPEFMARLAEGIAHNASRPHSAH